MSESLSDNRIQEALYIALRYGQIEGDHHRAWVIDRMVRALLGTDSAYQLWVQDYESGEPGETHEWWPGIAP